MRAEKARVLVGRLLVLASAALPASGQWHVAWNSEQTIPGTVDATAEVILPPVWAGEELVTWVRDNDTGYRGLLGVPTVPAGPARMLMATGDTFESIDGSLQTFAGFTTIPVGSDDGRVAITGFHAPTPGAPSSENLASVVRLDPGNAMAVAVAQEGQLMPTATGPDAPLNAIPMPIGFDGASLRFMDFPGSTGRVFEAGPGQTPQLIAQTDRFISAAQTSEGRTVMIDGALSLLETDGTRRELVAGGTPWPGQPDKAIIDIRSFAFRNNTVAFVGATSLNFNDPSAVFRYDLDTDTLSIVADDSIVHPWHGTADFRSGAVAVDGLGRIYYSAEVFTHWGLTDAPTRGEAIFRTGSSEHELMFDSRFHAAGVDEVFFTNDGLVDHRLAIQGLGDLNQALWANLIGGFAPQDFDRDRQIDVDDVVILHDVALSNVSTEGIPDSPMDIDGSGTITLNDYRLFVQSLNPIPGDSNFDDFVDQADLDAVLLNWGGGLNSIAEGNLDLEGFVDQADLDAVLLNWGNARVPSEAEQLPEPAAVLFLVAAVWCGRRGTHGHNLP